LDGEVIKKKKKKKNSQRELLNVWFVIIGRNYFWCYFLSRLFSILFWILILLLLELLLVLLLSFQCSISVEDIVVEVRMVRRYRVERSKLGDKVPSWAFCAEYVVISYGIINMKKRVRNKWKGIDLKQITNVFLDCYFQGQLHVWMSRNRSRWLF